MTDWSGNDYLDSLRSQPAARAPASIGEIWSTQYAAAGLDTIGGVGAPYREADDDLVKAIEGASGKGIADYARDKGVLLGAALTPVDRQNALSALADTLPDDARKTIEPLKDLRKRAAEKAKKIDDEAADVSSATYGLSGTATAFVAGTARMMVDPANIAAMIATAPIGGPLEGATLKVIGRQAAANAGAQALVEPYIEAKRGELGLDAGIGRAAENVLSAGVGGAVIGGGLLGLGKILRLGASSIRVSRERPIEAGTVRAPEPEGAGHFSPQDFDAAAALAERDHVIDTVAPGGGAAVKETHTVNLNAAADAIERGAPLPRLERPEPPVYETPTDWGGRSTQMAGEAPRPIPGGDPVVSRTVFNGDINAPGGQHGIKVVSVEGEPAAIAHLYRTGEGQITIQKIETLPAAQRRGYATSLVNDLLDEFPEARINTSMRTDAGRAFFDANFETYAGLGIRRPGTGEIAVKPRPSSKPRYRAHSLLEFIADNGGISAKDPLVADVMQSFGGQNHFQPGFGRIVRSEGKSLDNLREAAVEAGYLHDEGRQSGGLSTSTINDLLDAIDTEARDNRVYVAGAEGTKTKAELAGGKEADKAAREKARHEQGLDFDARMQELQITKVDVGMRKRALQIMEKEGETDPLLAFERALIEHGDKQDAIRLARQQQPELKIPGWDVADEPGPAPGHGGDAARGTEGSAGRGEPGGEPRADRGGAGSQGEPKAVGDPALKAEAGRALEARGGDVEITIPDENGNLRKVSARAAMREIDDEATAASEFKNCVGSIGGGV